MPKPPSFAFTLQSKGVQMLAAVALFMQWPGGAHAQLSGTQELSGAGLASASASASESSTRRLVYGTAGPWGRLEYYPVVLEAPDSLLAKFPLPNSRPRWSYPESRQGDVARSLTEAGMAKEVVEAMMAPSSMMKVDGMIHLFPPPGLLAEMPAEMRAKIYADLRRYPDNEFQYEPVIIASGSVEDWFDGSDLRPEIIGKIKQWSYMRDQTLVFSDLPLLMNFVKGEDEARQVVKACTRVRSLMVKLLVDKSTNLDAVLDFWTTGLDTRRKDLMPLLQSVATTPGVDGLDISHVLPPLARKLLMTYPDLTMGREGILPDCHWSSLNFFNYDAQPYLLDSRLATTAVLERFVPVSDPYRFGDVIFFLDGAGDAFHSCVYLADDIVFSKNGRNILSPWVLTTITDLKKVYLHDQNGRIQGYRNKKSPALPSDKGS